MTVTEFRQTFASLPSDGWLSELEALLLVDYASRTTHHMLEFGSYCGRSAKLLGTLAALTERELHCVDPWGDFGLPSKTGDQALEEFKTNIAGLPVGWWRSRVEDWKHPQHWSYGFIYCDGDHSYEGTLAQLRKAAELEPLIIAVHDVNDSGGGKKVKQACLELLGEWKERVERLAVWEVRL